MTWFWMAPPLNDNGYELLSPRIHGVGIYVGIYSPTPHTLYLWICREFPRSSERGSLFFESSGRGMLLSNHVPQPKCSLTFYK